MDFIHLGLGADPRIFKGSPRLEIRTGGRAPDAILTYREFGPDDFGPLEDILALFHILDHFFAVPLYWCVWLMTLKRFDCRRFSPTKS
jgi:hypothetical protein